MIEKIKYQIEVDQNTSKLIQDLASYENLRYKIKNKGRIVSEEDIIKAAIFHYVNEIKNYYKKTIISSQLNILKTGKLKNRLKEIMKTQNNLKQKELAQLTGIDEGSLSNILNNKSQPQMDYFLKIWIALDCPAIDEIFYYED